MAVDTGYVCEYCEREFDTEKGAALHERDWCPDNPASRKSQGVHVGRPKKAPEEESSPFGPEPAPPAETAPVEPGGPFEAAPEPARKPWRERIWGTGEAKGPAPARAPERTPRRRRRSTEGIWQLVWTGIGRGLVYTQADIPVGNAMTFQAPVVGAILDKAVAGTVLDTLLQPLAGAGERFEDVGDVVALPTLVAIMERSPALAPALEPLLRKAIRRHLLEYARMAKAQKREDDQYRKALDDLGMEAGEDPVDGIMAQIWEAQAQAGAASNGRAAGADVHP